LDYFEAREQEVQAHVGSVYYEGLAEPILLSQDLSGGCGGKIWESANVMIEYLIWKNQHMEGKLFQDQTLVEIGAGTGLVGLAVAKVCPQLRHLVITDQIPMMQLMQENININQQAHLVSGEILNW
ncbi:putative methyltransferase-domain-containing protein, partial [Gilbertella persicaria]|uniref:putative methyltransferase-domain-containing protein n=1 Tax=Gilbertella persicaria TaxID=101096 RepID=UPI0022208623